MSNKLHNKAGKNKYKEMILKDEDLLKPLIKTVLNEVLEADMEEALGAKKSERNDVRIGYRSGYKDRSLVTRIGKIELQVPQDRNGLFSTQVFERYQRSEKALVNSLVEMYIQGVSTRKVKKITEELCGHQFSASTISSYNKKLDKELQTFAERKLSEEYPYLVLDAKYERIRCNGIVSKQAVMIAIGINWEGRRQVLAVENANRESITSWKDFLIRLKQRGLSGVRLVISDDHAGLRKSIPEVFPESLWQRCYVHFMRNALDYLPRKLNDDSLTELRWIYERKNIQEAKNDLSIWLDKWHKKHPKLCDWVEDNIEDTLSFYSMPKEHHKNLKSTNMLERINEEIKRRTYVIRIFPNTESCLRLIRALAIELHEYWLDARYLNMDFLKIHIKQNLKLNNAA